MRQGRRKYIVYDDSGFILIITRYKNIARNIMKEARKWAAKKYSLVNNINKRRKAGTSRSKKDSTISPSAYKDMTKGWPKKKKK